MYNVLDIGSDSRLQRKNICMEHSGWDDASDSFFGLIYFEI